MQFEATLQEWTRTRLLIGAVHLLCPHLTSLPRAPVSPESCSPIAGSQRSSLDEVCSALAHDDTSYSGGEADGEQESRVPPRRSMSGSVVLEEQTLRSQSPGRRLSPASPRRNASSRSAATSPRHLASANGFLPQVHSRFRLLPHDSLLTRLCCCIHTRA